MNVQIQNIAVFFILTIVVIIIIYKIYKSFKTPTKSCDSCHSGEVCNDCQLFDLKKKMEENKRR